MFSKHLIVFLLSLLHTFSSFFLNSCGGFGFVCKVLVLDHPFDVVSLRRRLLLLLVIALVRPLLDSLPLLLWPIRLVRVLARRRLLLLSAFLRLLLLWGFFFFFRIIV